MECCGVNNYTDFREAGLFLEGNRQEGINRQVPVKEEDGLGGRLCKLASKL
jgi:hypothetical protein